MSTATARRPPRGVESYATDPMAFSDDLIMVNERGQPFRLLDHQREILRLAFAFDAEGRLPWDTLLWSSVKKDGKTTINALLLLWWAYTQEAPNEAYVLANDQEQSMARAFATAAKLIRNNPKLATSAKSIDARRIVLTNGTTITALASDYAGAAGSDHGITSWDELWAYSSEGSRRLWEELTPVPTRVNSIRIITTYAGWEGESTLLRELYLTGVGPEEHPDGRGERIHPTLPLYRNRETRLLCYWDHEARAPWQSAGYRESQRKTLRPGTFLRLHENRWVSAESSFIDGSLWDSCVEPEHAPLLFADPRLRVQVGVDAALKHDCAAVVAVTRVDDALFVVRHKIWRPSVAEPLDFELTVEAFVRELAARFAVTSVYVDPFQMMRSVQTLRRAGIHVVEYPQTPANLTRMAEALFELVKSGRLVVYRDDELRAHALNTTAVDSARGWKISKTTGARKIDAMVALAMACVAALDTPVRAPLRLL